MKVRGNVTHKIYFPNTRCYKNFPEKFLYNVTDVSL